MRAALLLVAGSLAVSAAAQGVPSLYFELDPIVITAPREKIPDQYRIDPRVNATLLRLLQSKGLRPDPNDSSLANLSKLVTQRGHKLKTRYTELSFLLLEGLAGVKDVPLQNALRDVTRTGENPQLRAAALVALGYTKNEMFLGPAQDAIVDENFTVRLGALEALLLLDSVPARDRVRQAAHDDQSFILRVIASAADWRRKELGFELSRQILRDYASHNDWFIRALATRYIGELGEGFEYRLLQSRLIGEPDPIVRAELAGALLRLKKFKDSE
ncbi:MAG: HEAT repeat domain-containing protein [Elusimicrobiota bacterium]